MDAEAFPFAKLKSYPNDSTHFRAERVNVLAMNKMEFIFVPIENGATLYKYSVIEDDWFPLSIRKPDYRRVKCLFDRTDEAFYWVDSECHFLIVVELSTGNVTECPLFFATDTDTERHTETRVTRMILTEQHWQVHGYSDLPQKNTFVGFIQDLKSHDVTRQEIPTTLGNKGNSSMGFENSVFISSRNEIISQVVDYNSDRVVLVKYSLSNKKYQYMDWTSMHRKYSQYISGMIVSLNEQYLVTFGGEGPDSEDEPADNGIMIHDLKHENMRESSVKCPRTYGSWGAVLLGSFVENELVTFGFVRAAFKSSEMRDVQQLPRYLVEFISKWYSNEQIHLIDGRNGNHWTVDLDYIICSA